MSAPVLGSISVDSASRVQIPVDDLGGNAYVRVDYAIAASVPDTTSRLWRTADTIDSPSTVETDVIPGGSVVWVRASGRDAIGTRTSSYTTPEYVTVDAAPDFTTTTFALTDRVPTVTWTPGALTLGVRLYYAVHEQGTDPGDLSTYEDVEAVYGTLTLSLELADGEAVTMRLEAWSGWSSGAVDGTEGQNVGATLVQSAPAVAAHGYTHGYDQTDPVDLGTLALTAPDASRWRLTVSNSGELGTEEIS